MKQFFAILALFLLVNAIQVLACRWEYFIIELDELNGRKAFPENTEITSLIVK
jgi:hypothetical protein